MRKPILLVLASVLLPVASTCVAGELDTDAAVSLFDTKCSKCHSVERPRQKNKSQEAWTHTVKRMQSKSPGWFSDDEAATLIEYLSRTQGIK